MKNYYSILLILLLPLLAVLGYATVEEPYETELTRIDLSSLDSLFTTESDSALAADTATCDTVAIDTTHQRILFVGDSMVEGLGLRMAQYAEANGHDLTYVTWYSSTTFAWCSDTLRHYIKEADPTFIMITIGGNEQSSKNTSASEKNIKGILDIIGDIPYIWICTPEWDKDAPFNFIPERICGKKHFFDSRKLTYERMKDHRHPTFAAAKIWMDSIAVWMQSQETAHPILMKVPADSIKGKCVKHSLKPNTAYNRNHHPASQAKQAAGGAAVAPAAGHAARPAQRKYPRRRYYRRR